MSNSSDLLLQELVSAFSQLGIPSQFLSEVILTTELVFKNHMHLEPVMPLTLQIAVESNTNCKSFNGVDTNLFSALPNELRLKVVDYVVDSRKFSDEDHHLFVNEMIFESRQLQDLQIVFPKDEIISQRRNSHLFISFSEDDYHVPYTGHIGDYEVLREKGDFFKYRAETVQFIPLGKCGDVAINKLVKILNKEKQLQNLKALDFSPFRTMLKIPFTKSSFNLKNLEIIQFDNTSIHQLHNLENFPNLKVINCSFTHLHAIHDISYLAKLETLNLTDNALTVIPSTINKLHNLRILRLSRNDISKIENLYNLKKLTHLDLSMNRIQSIENLNGCVALKHLHLVENHDIIQIKNLNSLTKLTKLDLSCTSILKIENLSNLSNLEHLDLCQTNVSKLENLDELTNLKVLMLRNCTNGSFKRLENLETLVNLVDLLISPCQDITHLENLDNLINLERLSINRHSLTKLENVATLKKLKLLDLSFGTLESVNELNKLSSLEEVDFNFNKIKKVGNISMLSELKIFKINERVYERAKYKSTKLYLRSLAKLTNEELNDDMEYFNDIRRMVFSDLFQYSNVGDNADPYPDDDFMSPQFEELVHRFAMQMNNSEADFDGFDGYDSEGYYNYDY